MALGRAAARGFASGAMGNYASAIHPAPGTLRRWLRCLLPFNFAGNYLNGFYADETIFLPARLAAEQVGQPVPVLTAWGDERHTWPSGHRHQAARRLPGITSQGVRVPL